MARGPKVVRHTVHYVVSAVSCSFSFPHQPLKVGELGCTASKTFASAFPTKAGVGLLCIPHTLYCW